MSECLRVSRGLIGFVGFQICVSLGHTDRFLFVVKNRPISSKRYDCTLSKQGRMEVLTRGDEKNFLAFLIIEKSPGRSMDTQTKDQKADRVNEKK